LRAPCRGKNQGAETAAYLIMRSWFQSEKNRQKSIVKLPCWFLYFSTLNLKSKHKRGK